MKLAYSLAEVTVNKLRNLHHYMKNQGIDELMIYTGFGSKIEESVKELCEKKP